MSEFSDTFGAEKLLVPESCQGCPRVRSMEQQIQAKTAAVEQIARKALFASPRTQRVVAIESMGGGGPASRGYAG